MIHSLLAEWTESLQLCQHYPLCYCNIVAVYYVTKQNKLYSVLDGIVG